MDSLQFVSTKRQLFFLSFFIFLIFIFNIFYKYLKYQDFTEEEIYLNQFEIVNIYDKKDFYILKLHNSVVSFFTSINKEEKINKLDFIEIAVITKKISFFEFLKGFYAKSIFYENVVSKNSFKSEIHKKINSLHKNEKVKELFNALFLAIPISKQNRQIYTDFSISHLIAISGFHLSLISSFIFIFLYYPYSLLHNRFFPFRNKRADIMLITIGVLFYYLYLTNIVPSLLRSFIMFFLAFIYLRSNIKVLSYQSLFITFLIIIAVFPKYLFSISLWFSFIGVFYIFLYFQYFKRVPKLFSIIFFNFWIFFIFNPIVHFFFANISYEQLLSPFLTFFFSFFYPIEILVHLFGFADIFDVFIVKFLNYEVSSFDFFTPFWFFIIYIFFSFSSIFIKNYFLILNILAFIFNLYIFVFI